MEEGVQMDVSRAVERNETWKKVDSNYLLFCKTKILPLIMSLTALTLKTANKTP